MLVYGKAMFPVVRPEGLRSSLWDQRARDRVAQLLEYGAHIPALFPAKPGTRLPCTGRSHDDGAGANTTEYVTKAPARADRGIPDEARALVLRVCRESGAMVSNTASNEAPPRSDGADCSVLTD